MADDTAKGVWGDLSISENEYCEVRGSDVHGEGVFALMETPSRVTGCVVPGWVYDGPTRTDFIRQKYLWDVRKVDPEAPRLLFDASGFKGVTVGKMGIGHFVNSAHPLSSDTGLVPQDKTCKFYPCSEKCIENSTDTYYSVDVQTIVRHGEGDEYFEDYHWHLANMSEADVKNGEASPSMRRAGNECECEECKKVRTDDRSKYAPTFCLSYITSHSVNVTSKTYGRREIVFTTS
jgi:hypothetical protein